MNPVLFACANFQRIMIPMKKLVILFIYIVFCFGFSFSVQSQPSEFSLLESGNKSMVVGFDLPEYKLNTRTTGTSTFTQIYVENSAPMLQAEAPELPYYSFSMQAPQTAGPIV